MANLASLVGTKATINGTARNAHAGAVVLTDDRTPVYIDGLESWDETDLDGESVAVEGTLNKRPIVPQAETAADGAVSHGMDAEAVFVIDNASWSKAD